MNRIRARARDRLKATLARVARNTALAPLLRRARPPVLLPLYHAVAAEAPAHLRHLYPVRTPAQFARDLDFLLAHFQPLTPAGLVALARDNRLPAEPSFLITFDDGLGSFATEAAPLLAERGLTAICFLNPAFVDNRALMHRCKASVLIDLFEQVPALAQRPEVRRWRRPAAPGPLREELLGIRYPQRDRLDTLAQHLGVDWREWLANHQPYLSRKEIQRLAGEGFHFGAHSLDHPEYALLPPAEQQRQTRASVDWVAEQLAPELRLFALPFTDFGLPQSFFRELYAAGIDLSFGTAGLKRDTDVRHFQRVPFEVSEADAATLVKTELLYYLLKAPLGRNRIRRP
jgi:peptidoglycan/xylan/chitin deacetylase (PgdA/CDA1 family)